MNMSMKVTKPDKHYITEYYLRKGYVVEWIEESGVKGSYIEITNRTTGDVYCFNWYIPIRNFINEVDFILRDNERERENF